MNDLSNEGRNAAIQEVSRPEYVAPAIRVMSEAEVLSAFQVTAAGGSPMWWVM